MKDLGMSTQQKPLPQGVPASSPQPMLRGLPSQQLTEQQGALSTTRAWDKAGNPEGGCSEAKWAVRPHYTRHNDHTTPDTMGRHPDRGIHGAHNAPHRVWQTNLGQNLYILMKKQRPLRQGILWREQTDSEVRELCCMFQLRSTDHNCSSYFLQVPHPVCHFSSMLQMKAGIVQTAHTTHISLNQSLSKPLF